MSFLYIYKEKGNVQLYWLKISSGYLSAELGKCNVRLHFLISALLRTKSPLQKCGLKKFAEMRRQTFHIGLAHSRNSEGSLTKFII